MMTPGADVAFILCLESEGKFHYIATDGDRRWWRATASEAYRGKVTRFIVDSGNEDAWHPNLQHIGRQMIKKFVRVSSP